MSNNNFNKSEPYKRTLLNIGPIIYRHVFLFVNGVIFSVVILLFFFGNKEAAIFLGIITLFNILLGIIQDTRARIALETLQLVTALRVTRISKDGKEESILADEVEKGDHIKLRVGDQVPCDGILILSHGVEVSEALVTGESDSFPRAKGAEVSAGDVVTAGSGMFEAQSAFRDSRMAHMTAEAKKYSASPSPIQHAINKVISYTGYILFVVILFVVGRGLIVHESALNIVLNIGALASTIIPQGLVVITTLLFAFGASSYSKKHVLFQEINATEKLGRIKNICMDKTGTLTENFLEVEQMYVFGKITKEEASMLTTLYLQGSQDSSQTIDAVKKYLAAEMTAAVGSEIDMKVTGALPFSSWRQYGAVEVSKDTVFVGSPDTFMAHLSDPKEKQWLAKIIDEHSHAGKRVLCVAHSPKTGLPEGRTLPKLSVVAVFVFQSGFREGVRQAIEFFQKRGVKIRIISGDNVDTVRAVATSAGVENTDSFITGPEMANWSVADFDEKVHTYTIFARTVPEQKVKIIEALKKDGFTAMVGDGANDALAIKKSDLGIAMFDGVQATRSLAGVILMKNSFADLPGGVELADNFIRNIEIFAGIFINQSVLGILLFVIISFFGFAFPLTQLNITLINYFAVGIPGMLIGYWAIRPTGKILPANTDAFLSLVLPFVIWSAVLESIAVAIVLALSPAYLKAADSNTLVALGFIVCGFIFFTLAPRVYRGVQTVREKWHLFYLAIFEVVFLLVILSIPWAVRFFNVTTPFPTTRNIGIALAVLLVFGIAQYILTKKFFVKD